MNEYPFCKDCKFCELQKTERLGGQDAALCKHPRSLGLPDLVFGHQSYDSCLSMRCLDCGQSGFLFQQKAEETEEEMALRWA